MNAYKGEIAPFILHPRLLVAAQSLPHCLTWLLASGGYSNPQSGLLFATWKEIFTTRNADAQVKKPRGVGNASPRPHS